MVKRKYKPTKKFLKTPSGLERIYTLGRGRYTIVGNKATLIKKKRKKR